MPLAASGVCRWPAAATVRAPASRAEQISWIEQLAAAQVLRGYTNSYMLHTGLQRWLPCVAAPDVRCLRQWLLVLG